MTLCNAFNDNRDRQPDFQPDFPHSDSNQSSHKGSNNSTLSRIKHSVSFGGMHSTPKSNNYENIPLNKLSTPEPKKANGVTENAESVVNNLGENPETNDKEIKANKEKRRTKSESENENPKSYNKEIQNGHTQEKIICTVAEVNGKTIEKINIETSNLLVLSTGV